MTDIIKQANGFRLSVNPMREDVWKANWLINRLSARVSEADRVLRMAGDLLEAYKVNGIELGDASRMPFVSDVLAEIDAAIKGDVK